MARRGIIVVCLLFFLGGCGGPKADVNIFMMAWNGITNEQAMKLDAELKAMAGDELTIQFVTSPLYYHEKLVVEVAGGSNDIIIIPSQPFQSMAVFDGYVDLSEQFNADDFPDGILELKRKRNDGTIETKEGLYGIPLNGSKWYLSSGIQEDGLIAFILSKSKRQDNANKVIQWIAERE